MPPRTNFLEKQRKQIADRLQELRPAYEEYLTLLDAQEALDSVKRPAAGSTDGRRTRTRSGRGPGRPPGRPPTSGRKRGPGRPPGRTARKGRGGRRRAGDTRADQALALINSNPGITIAELADKLGIRQNYLYRVMAELQRRRQVKRRNRGFHPA
jgi:hypothetical protein